MRAADRGVSHKLAATVGWVALLRGINVGRAKRVAMADLRALVENLGYMDVRTLLNSGNVVFNVPDNSKGDPAARIEAALARRLGVASRVIVLTTPDLDRIVKGNTLLDVASNPSRLLVAVLSDQADRRRLETLRKQDWAPDALAVGDRVAYMWCAGGILASRLAEAAGRALGETATTRNWGTILKLHALTRDPG